MILVINKLTHLREMFITQKIRQPFGYLIGIFNFNQFPYLVSDSNFKWKEFQFFIVRISYLPRCIDKDNRSSETK